MKPGVYRIRAKDGTIGLIVYDREGVPVELLVLGRGEPPRRRVPKYLGPDLRTVIREAEERAERRRMEAWIQDAEEYAQDLAEQRATIRTGPPRLYWSSY